MKNKSKQSWLIDIRLLNTNKKIKGFNTVNLIHLYFNISYIIIK